jgi:signal transduction histidine kinase
MRSSSAGTGAGTRFWAGAGWLFPSLSSGDWHAFLGRATALRAGWRGLDLAQRYLVAALFAVIAFAALASIWLGDQAGLDRARGETQAAVALIHHIVEPLVQGLPATENVSNEARTAFDNLMAAPDVAAKVAALRLWHPDGTLVYRSDRAPGAAHEAPPSVLDQSTLEQERGVTLFETSVPIHKSGTREVIAVAQLYGVAGAGDTAGILSWLGLAALALAMLAVPFRMVQDASTELAGQEKVLAEQKTELARLTSRNEALRKLVDLIHRRGMEHNERLLRRIGSDLHDGPAQHLALVLLRLDELVPALEKPGKGSAPAKSGAPDTLETVRRATADALKEIRHISSGLALPELQKISLKDALLIAVRAHQRATGTQVAATFEDLPARLPLPMTICLYRFAQEALNNAFRHAGAAEQRLSARYDGATICVEISDSGPGFAVEQIAAGGERLGLPGLRYRVESLGGSLQINSQIGRGTQLIVQFRNPLA